MRTLPRNGLVALAAIVPLALSSTALSAQQKQTKPESMAACTSTVQPNEIHVGKTATRLSIALSSPIGDVNSFVAEGSGLTISTPEDLPRVPMASEAKGEAKGQKPIEMANEGNRVMLWLNTANAKAGTYDFTLVGADGQCTGKVTLSPEGKGS